MFELNLLQPAQVTLFYTQTPQVCSVTAGEDFRWRLGLVTLAFSTLPLGSLLLVLFPQPPPLQGLRGC